MKQACLELITSKTLNSLQNKCKKYSGDVKYFQSEIIYLNFHRPLAIPFLWQLTLNYINPQLDYTLLTDSPYSRCSININLID